MVHKIHAHFSMRGDEVAMNEFYAKNWSEVRSRYGVPVITFEDIILAFNNNRAESRIVEVKAEIDGQLLQLSLAKANNDIVAEQIALTKLQELHAESLQLEI